MSTFIRIDLLLCLQASTGMAFASLFKRLHQSLIYGTALGALICSMASAAKPDAPVKNSGPRLVVLGNTPGESSALNNVGEVVGNIGSEAAYWQLDVSGNVNTSAVLSKLDGASMSQASAINLAGTIAGHQYVDGFAVPVVWTNAWNEPFSLPILDGFGGQATSIDDTGLVVGVVMKNGSESLVVWQLSADGSSVLKTTEILTHIRVTRPSISAQGGWISVNVSPDSTNFRSIRLRVAADGTELPGRTQLFSAFSIVTDVASDGTTCGAFNGIDGLSHREAFALTAQGVLLNLPQLPGGRYRGNKYDVHNHVATSINDVGQVAIDAAGVQQDNGIIVEDFELLATIGGDAEDLTITDHNFRFTAIDEVNDLGWCIGNAYDLETSFLPAVVIR